MSEWHEKFRGIFFLHSRDLSASSFCECFQLRYISVCKMEFFAFFTSLSTSYSMSNVVADYKKIYLISRWTVEGGSVSINAKTHASERIEILQ